MDTRKTEILYKEEWYRIPFDHVKSGDVFRLIESTGEFVVDENGKTEFIATSDPYQNEEGIWTVKCE